MNKDQREEFWKVLCGLDHNLEECKKKLKNVICYPELLCRFRPVTKNSLKQLQDNKLYFSSANYYDDPFDTFVHINFERLKGISLNYEEKKEKIEELFLNQKDVLLEVRNMIQAAVYSISFCENPKNENLWLKYAENHRGFVLIYNLKNDCLSKAYYKYIYPLYYSNESYDATKYCLNLFHVDNLIEQGEIDKAKEIEKSLLWELERVSLIKKKCHEYDEEWRMLCPDVASEERPYIKIKPTTIALGLKMEKYERLMVVSAAKVAGITDIQEMYINEKDELDMRPFNILSLYDSTDF